MPRMEITKARELGGGLSLASVPLRHAHSELNIHENEV